MTIPARPGALPGNIALRLLKSIVGRTQGLPPLSPGDLRRVLLLRYDRLGDMVITTPLIEALHRIAPRAEIDVLGSNANRALIESDPRINRVWVWGDSPAERLRVIRACRARHYDAVFQLLFSRTTLPAIFAGILAPHARIIGKSTIGHDFLFNHAVTPPGGHYSVKTLSLLEGAFVLENGLPELPYSIHIPEPERRHAAEVLADAGLEPGKFILLNISAGNALRELSVARNAELARGLAGLGFRVGIVGTPDAAARGREIASQSGAAPLTFRSLLAAAAAMEQARLVVTPDTGTLHLAAATGTPVVGMYAANGDPAGWYPHGVPHATVQIHDGNTLESIAIDDVVDAARNVLATEI